MTATTDEHPGTLPCSRCTKPTPPQGLNDDGRASWAAKMPDDSVPSTDAVLCSRCLTSGELDWLLGVLREAATDELATLADQRSLKARVARANVHNLERLARKVRNDPER